MYEVVTTPAVAAALVRTAPDVRGRFFAVTDHLATRPLPGQQDGGFWDTGDHFEIYRPPLLLFGIFMHDLRVIYVPETRRRTDGTEQHLINVYAFSQGPSPIAGWEYR